MLITIIIAVFFFFFLAKAILETIWGLCMVIHGLTWRAISIALMGLANIVRTYNKVVRMFRKPKPAPRKADIAGAICMYFSNVK